MSAFCLAVHAGYRCQHAGACCQNWAVPAEADVIEVVTRMGLRRRGTSGTLFLSAVSSDPQIPDAWTVARDERGDCVFFDRDAGHSCVIHREAGIAALPAACRHFPRKVRIDARDTRISLSHYCPTAAGLLLTGGGLEIVEAAAPLLLPVPMEGLDATAALPPLVRPGLLSDLEGYNAWERAALSIFSRPGLTHEECLDLISAATESLRRWRPQTEPLATRVTREFEVADAGQSRDRTWCARTIQVMNKLSCGRASPLPSADQLDEEWTRHVGDQHDWLEGPTKNYLAARLFGNWIAYQGRGLRTVLEWLRACAAVVRSELLARVARSVGPPTAADFIEAVRAADLRLLHVLDSAMFAQHVAAIEGPDPR
jgi:Fe-S-cluster containining protein